MEAEVKVEYIPYEQLSQQGMYYTDSNRIAKVRKSRQSGMLYAMILNEMTHKFEYQRGLVYRLIKRMTLEEATAYGIQYGFCCVCGLLLTNKKSVKLGIGPICRGYF